MVYSIDRDTLFLWVQKIYLLVSLCQKALTNIMIGVNRIMQIGRDTQIIRPQPTSEAAMNQALEDLDANKQKWISLSLESRIRILEDVQHDFRKVWERLSLTSVLAKGLDARELGNDKDWLDIALITRIHAIVHRMLCEIRDYGTPRVPNPLKKHEDGRVKVQVYPDTRLHGMLFRGITHEVWFEPGIEINQIIAGQAEKCISKSYTGGVALVLGAGNAAALIPSDVFHKLFHDLQVVALKMNPVNSYLGPLFEEAYRSLIEGGFLRILYGGSSEGTYLVEHPLVDEIHMTGSAGTFETIVFGSGRLGIRNREERNPKLKKPFSSELGCITPWIVVPDGWTSKHVKLAASRMAYWMIYQEGYTCFAPRLLVFHQGWEYRRQFLDVLAESLAQVPTMPAYYPSSLELQRDFISEHPDATRIGGKEENHIPWTIIEGINPNSASDICFNRESFSGLCAECSLNAKSTSEFLELAVNFLNNSVWGNLSATVIVPDESFKDHRIRSEVENAVTNLEYGSIGINVPGVFAIYNMISPWGAYPGNNIYDIQSGIGKVANFLLLPYVEKVVVRAPLATSPFPFRVDAKNLDLFCKKFANFEANQSFRNFLKVVVQAYRM